MPEALSMQRVSSVAKQRTRKVIGRAALHGLHDDLEHDLDLDEGGVAVKRAHKSREPGSAFLGLPRAISVRIPTWRQTVVSVSASRCNLSQG